MMESIIQFILIPFTLLAGILFPAAPPTQVVETVDMSEVIAIEGRIDDVEEELNNIGATLAIPTPVALFEDALASGISSSATSFTLITGTDIVGTSLASSTYGFIMDEGTASQEFVLADCTATACTNAVRGISPITGTSTVAILQKSHRRGATVKITDGPIILILKNIINGEAPFPNALTFKGASQDTTTGVFSYDSAPTFTPGSNQFASILYSDNIANQGAATSSPTIAGISEEATPQETASSTPFDVDNPHHVSSENASSTPSAIGCDGTANAGALCVIVAKLSGKISQLWIDLTEAFTWTNTHTFNKTVVGGSSTMTDAATTTFDWAEGQTGYWDIGANRALHFENVTAATAVRVVICQDGTGSRLVTNWPGSSTSTIRWAGGFAPTLTTTADKCDTISFYTTTSTDQIFAAPSLNY